MVENNRFPSLISIADELIQSNNGTTDTLLNLGARLRSPSSWPWRLVTILMVLRFVQGRAIQKNVIRSLSLFVIG